MTLRRATADNPAFRALYAALDAELRATYGAVQDSYAPLNHVETLDTVVIAEDAAGAPIGCGCWRRYDDTAVEIKRVFVPPAHRGQGVAARVVAELEAWARERGFRAAVLETGNRQRAAIALYERCGYAIVELFPPYVGMPASVCMRKVIAP